MEEKSTPEVTKVTGGQDDHSQDTSASSADTVVTADEQGDAQGNRVTSNDESNSEEGEQSSGEKKESSAQQYDPDLDEWAKKRGYGDLKTDLEKRLAQDTRNNQRALSKGKQEAKAQVEKQVEELYENPNEEDFDDPVERQNAEILREQALLRSQLKTRDFFDVNPDARQYAAEMTRLIKEERDLNGVEAARYLSSNLERLYVLAKASAASSEVEDAVAKARREERELLAKKQQASGASSAASTREQPKKEDPAEIIMKMSPAEYRKKRAEGWNPIRDL